MKVKVVFMVVVAITGGLAFGWHVGSANTEIDLEPLTYDKLEFKQNTNYLHDEGKIEMKNTIPVEQFDINFDGSKQLPKRDNTSYLFQTAERGVKSTVAAKTSELGLFTEEDQAEKLDVAVQMNNEAPATNHIRTLIFIGIIGVGIIFLFTFLLPKLVNEQGADRRSFNK